MFQYICERIALVEKRATVSGHHESSLMFHDEATKSLITP